MRAGFFLMMYFTMLCFGLIIALRPDLVYPKYRVCEDDGSLWRVYEGKADADLCLDGLTAFYDGLRTFRVEQTPAPLAAWLEKKGEAAA